MACFARIKKLLNSDARQDHRLDLKAATSDEQLPESGHELHVLSNAPSLRKSGTILTTQNASFGWKSDGNPTVSDVNLTIARGSFCLLLDLLVSHL